jgi:sugar O-acyltransferase (sialic acid O-acetyltransferase NeuD family)
MVDYVLVGGGAFAREVHDWFAPSIDGRFIGYLDDGDAPMAARGRDLPQLGDTHGYVPHANQRLVLAVADPKGKEALASRLRARGATFATLVHPMAWLSASARLGAGCLVGPFCDVSADARAEEFVTLNAYASIGHDVSVGAFATLSGYVDLTGGVEVARGAFFGSGARVLPGLKIGEGCIIGAGAVIVRNTIAGASYYAAPARKL